MKLAKIGALVWLVGFTSAANTAFEQELFRAAKNGQVPSIQAALKAGANVNARFDVGKTALMVAAEQGRDAAVEALMDAGADLYVLDNNNLDALAHAAMHSRVSTVNLLLRKGFDPSKNNWRALGIVRDRNSGRNRRNRRVESNLEEVRVILEDAYKNSGSNEAIGGLSGGTSPATTRVQRRAEKIASPVLIDVSEIKLAPEMYKTMATKAFLQRGWQNITAEADHLTATLNKRDREYRARILLRPPLIKISFVEGYGSDSPSWLLNLKKDLEFEINMAFAR